MRASISLVVIMVGETAQATQSRTDDGGVGITPTNIPAAVAGVLTTRSSNTAGVITASGNGLATGNKAVLTWEDDDGARKHRYDVECTVAGSLVTFASGAGDNLPDEDEVVNIAYQIRADEGFDFDAVDTFVITANVRTVAVFMDVTDAEKCVVDLSAGGFGLWQDDTGFPPPATGTPVAYVLFGSGSITTTQCLPKVLALYDATVGSGQ